ncbi:MAG: hypothetical protein ACQETH_16660, partial [Candidatus Rifleibacteriota bacterium]
MNERKFQWHFTLHNFSHQASERKKIMKSQANKGWLVILCVCFLSCTFLLPAFCQCGISSFKAETTEIVWSPQDTLALLVGILHWPDKNFASYDQENRQDKKLYKNLLNRGIKPENLIFLKDEEATLERINESLKKLAKKGNGSSTFLFYYAGHGDRIN